MKRLAILLVLLMATSAWGATRYLPLKFVPGDPGDDADSVHAFVFDASGAVDSVKLVANSSHDVIFWEGQTTVTLDSIYHVIYKAWYDGGTDSALYAGDPILMSATPWTAAGVDSAWTMINEFIDDAPRSEELV